MIEVEIKVKLANPDKFRELIFKRGGKKVSEKTQEDYYFSPIHRDFWNTLKCLRIRKIKGQKLAILTYKPRTTKKMKEEKMHYKKEIETEVDSEAIMEIFKELDIKTLIIVKKFREKFNLNNFEITIDNVDQLGYFAEIALLIEDPNNVEEAKQKIYDFIKTMDLSKKNLLNQPYRCMLREKLKKK